MGYLAQLAAWSLLAFSVVLFLTQGVAREIGYWIGSRKRAAWGDREAEAVGLVVGGMLGLLGFVLALTPSFGSSRFEERRGRTLAEANAIGTAWLRAEAIGQSRGNEIARLLEDYARVRKEYVLAPWNSPINARLRSRPRSGATFP